ncbi:hypothetical protein CFC21_070171 [Triticum aestivum]|uniref:Coatomer subunit beta n=2 Tax=Triticum aestivum TaxID=4565 RepID=A0A9R1KRG0_WHEAT|nr:hypothetical protein CFC21_070171 [Triticum aestivum]
MIDESPFPCTLLLSFFDTSRLSTSEEMNAGLEGSDVGAKVDALKRAIVLLLNGDTAPHLLATVVSYVLPSKEHIIQRLLLLYLEVAGDKRDEAYGELVAEMILVRHYLRSNLQHPNEYVRGVTLRFLCRLREPEPLVPSILANLKHPHPFVRRHTLSAMSAICCLPCPHIEQEKLIPDTPDLAERALAVEHDPAARTNAFLVLCDCSHDRAIAYLLANAARVTEWPAPLQMAVIHLIRRVYSAGNRLLRSAYIKIIISLLSAATTAAVMYDCACTLSSVSHAPTLIARTYLQLLTSQSDSNVKLIILDRLRELSSSHHYMMVGFTMDLLRSLAGRPDLDVRRKVLELVVPGLLTTRNVEDVVHYLKEEVYGVMGSVFHIARDEYYHMLIRAIHVCAVPYPEVVGPVVHLLWGHLRYGDVASASDVVLFLREIIEDKPLLRSSIVSGLIGTFYKIKESFIFSCALWILGEYTLSLYEVDKAIAAIKESLGDQPFYADSEEIESVDSSKPAHPAMDSCTVCSKRLLVALLSDTYTTHSAATDDSIFTSGVFDYRQNLRALIMSGDFHLAAAVACTLTKLVVRLQEVQPSKVEANKASAEALLIMVSMLRLGKSSYLPHPIDIDSYDRIVFCVRLLCSTDDDHSRKVWLLSCRQSFANMIIAGKKFRQNEKMKVQAQSSLTYPDDSIDFYHLESRRGLDRLELEDEVQDDLKAATGESMKGFSDPVYAEGFVTVNEYYDTVLDITVINRTEETLHNLWLEFATASKTAVVDRSKKYTVAPQASKQIQANIKMSSTNVGVIVSRIFYETSDAMEPSEVILKDMSISIMDYMTPATCTDVAFRKMWAECWCKVKLKVNTEHHDGREFVNFIIKSVKMPCVTPLSALDGDCGLVAANLYGKSVFGEDALANISVEKQADSSKLSGYITIRGNVQGLVLNLAHAIIATQQITVDAAMSLSEACHEY